MVEQAGFSDIWFAEDHGACAFAQDASLIGGCEQGIDIGEHAGNFCAQRGAGFWVDVFFGKVDPCFEVRERFEQRVARFGGLAAKASFELVPRSAQGEPRLGRDQIHHALGLSEVELAVEKCVLGEFTGCGHHRTAFEKAAEHFARHKDAAVTGELDAGFAGETSRRTKDRE